MAGHKHSNSNSKRLSVDLTGEGERRRTLTLSELRPLELIGRSAPLFPWRSRFVADLNRVKNSKTREFYAHQNEAILALQFVDEVLDSGLHASLIGEYSDDIGEETPRERQPVPHTVRNSQSDAEAGTTESETDIGETGDSAAAAAELPPNSKVVRFWIHLNLLANVVLLMAKYAVYRLTNSLSIGASLVDSLLDLLSTLIIFLSARLASRRDKQMYPAGRFRLEPIGILVFSVVMVVSFMNVADDAFKRLLSHHNAVVTLTTASLVVMVGTILVKGVIWWLCNGVRNSSVRALSQDALTDCNFNFFSIVFPILSGVLNQPSLDPLGALLLSVYVIHSWGRTAMEHIDNLTGAACSPLMRQQILYMCTRFSERIKYITALNAYHAGDRLLVEVDVLLDSTLSMRDQHDIAEALQYALETLPIVERAFVHIDYRRGNFTGHVV